MPILRPIPVALFLLASLSVAEAAPQLPRPAPDLAISMPQGKQIRLSQYKGKPVVMLFILTYCEHCQRTVGILSKLQREYGPKGLQVVGSATEDMANVALPGFLKRLDPPFPVGTNTLQELMSFMQHPIMEQLFMPGIAFIDKTGTIRAQFEGRDSIFEEASAEQNLRAQIDLLMGGPAAAKKAAATKATPKK
jgi:peroxiredoxin